MTITQINPIMSLADLKGSPTVLPEKASPDYFITMDAFVSGGGLYWSSAARIASSETSNGWSVTKLINGLMIATLTKNYGTVTCNQLWGSAWYGVCANDQALPSGFIATPTVYTTYIGGSGLFQLRAALSSPTKINYVYVVEFKQSAQFSSDVRFFAIGRWK